VYTVAVRSQSTHPILVMVMPRV